MEHSMSVFNPEAYLNATFTEPTKKAPPLAPQDYTGVLGQVTVKNGEKEKDGITRKWVAYEIPITIQVPADQQPALPATVTRRWSIFLDLNDNGAIDTSVGKNRGLRQLREAVNKNNPGDIFSPGRDVEGKVVTVRIKAEIYQGEPSDQIDSVARG
jgi:hypothetical protein